MSYHVDKDKLNLFGDYPEMFAALLQAQDASLKVRTYDLIFGQLPEDIHTCDAYIITGSRFGVYEDIPWIHEAKKLVKRIYDAKIPTIGICFGHQLIASALGGDVIKAENKGHALGVQTWEIVDQPEWMDNSSLTTLSLNASHQDQVIKLPKGGKLFAGSDFCPIAGFQIDSMLTFQGHPEFDRAYTEYLVKKHESKLDSVTLEKTMGSLDNIPNSNTVGSWMVQFIKSVLDN
jgi:GMP synthase-like glutamine amidotransferase